MKIPQSISSNKTWKLIEVISKFSIQGLDLREESDSDLLSWFLNYDDTNVKDYM